MRIAVGCDHVAISLKEAVLEHLRKRGVEAIDAGPSYPDVVVDYQDYAQKVAIAVSNHEVDRGIVICGTGLGVSIAANKVPGARAALCHDVYTAHQARAHNDANILAMGAWIVSPQRMEGIVDEWLGTPFEGGRHTARVNVLDRHFGERTAGQPFEPAVFQYAMALSIRSTVFGPVLFSGRIEEGLATLNKAGFHFVELSIRNADDIPVIELKSILKKYELKAAALATGQGCLHDQLCFTATDSDLHKRAVQRFKEIIDLAHDLETGVIFGGVRGKLSGSLDEQSRQRDKAMESFRICADYAMQQGVGLFIEPINRYETNFINTAAEAVDFIDRTGAKSTKVLLDSFHMNIEEVDILTTLRMTRERLGYFHLVDSNRQAPGQGHLDFKSIFETLYQVGYRGPISAEILPVPDDESAVLRTRNFLDTLKTLAKRG